MGKQLTLISRGYCHLCDEMADALRPLLAPSQTVLQIVDVDADPVLLEQYDERVPVLLAGDAASGHEICHYFLDEQAVLAYLQEERQP